MNDWTKRLQYETIFTALTHHEVENKPPVGVYLNDELLNPIRPSPSRYEIIKNMPLP